MKRIFAHVVVLVNGSTADAIQYQLGIFVALDSILIMLWRQKAYNTRFDIVINEYIRPFISIPLHIILLLIMDIDTYRSSRSRQQFHTDITNTSHNTGFLYMQIKFRESLLLLFFVFYVEKLNSLLFLDTIYFLN